MIQKKINLKYQFEIPDGSNSLLDIQDCFDYISKIHEKVADNSSIKIYVNKTENSVTIKIKTRYYLELLTLEEMKLLGNTKTRQLKIRMVKICLIQKVLKQY